MDIAVREVRKSFGRYSVLKGVDLDVAQGEIIALLGPSGCGKTTLLRIIAGLEMQDSGTVHFGGVDAGDIRVRARRVGFVFQHYALFTHMTVFDNIAFGLRVRPRKERPDDRTIRRRVSELLGLVKLEQIAQRLPHQLSGGQRQRVALARALAVQPQILLLDEPFGALDASVRRELRKWLRRLHDELHITSIFVTHDQSEALELADRVAVMNHGLIEQVGTADAVYADPATAFVCGFLGEANVLRGDVRNGQVRVGEWLLEAPGVREGAAAQVYVRPHDLEIAPVAAGPNGHVRARVRRIWAAGSAVRLDLVTSTGVSVEAEMPREQFSELAVGVGADVYVAPRQKRIFAEGRPDGPS